MKNYLLLLFSLVFILGISLKASGTPIPPVRTMDVPFAPVPPVMDGVADDLYGEVQTTDIFNPTGYEGPADLTGTFRVCWDHDYFYWYCEVVDDVNHSYEWHVGNPWEFDQAHIYFQLDTNTVVTAYGPTTAQMRVCRGLDSIETPWMHVNRSEFLYYMEADAAEGWIFEVAIPWTAILYDGAMSEDIMDYVGSAIGFDVDISDSDNSDGDYAIGNRDVQAAWDMDDPDDPEDRTEDLAWNNTSVFGYITLMEGPVNPRPIADAGPNQTVMENTLVQLDGTGSYDPEGETITYIWFAPGPISLSDIHSSTPTFTAPNISSNTHYDIGLTVNDGLSNSEPDYVRINVLYENVPPVADAGPSQTVNERSLVMLDGSGSWDEEGVSLSYNWSTPAEINIVSAHTPNPILVAPDVFHDETVKFVLKVNDGIVDSDPDTMSLYVNALYDEYDTLVVYDTAYVVDVVTNNNTIIISVVDNNGDLIAREEEGILYVSLYPNPAEQFINVSSEMTIYELEILDLSGNVLKYELINALTAEINLGDFIAGNYILRLDTESGVVTKQFVLE